MGWSLLTLAALAWLLAAERSAAPARFAAKPVASAGFIAVALAVGAADSAFGRWMLVALVLSMLGDIFLLGAGERAFVVGLGSFLAAHLAFGGAFLVRGLEPAGLVAALPFAVFAALVLRWLGPHLSDRLRIPVLAYAIAISVMGVLAVATALSVWDWRIPTGAVLFIVSDVAVARNAFVAPAYPNRLWGLPLYYAGQVLLAWAAGG